MLVVNARGAPNVTSLEVIRAEEQGFKELDEVYVMMHLAKMQQLIYGKSATQGDVDHAPAAPLRSDPGRDWRVWRPILAKFSSSQPLAVLDFRTLNPFYVQTDPDVRHHIWIYFCLDWRHCAVHRQQHHEYGGG